MTHDEEQKSLFLNYLDNHIFCYWKEDESKKKQYDASLELIITPTCNTSCSYCYYKNFADKYLYPKEINCKENIIANCEKIMKWVQKNNYKPENIEIFSGEFINLPYCEEILEIIDRYAANKTRVIIPTNGTFCRSEKALEKAQKIMDTYEKTCSNHNIQVIYSLSIDGKYLDNDTRPMKNGTLYDDAFYDRLFKFAVKNDQMFHPMIAAHNIDKWIDNFDWYINNIMKYFNCTECEAFERLYLLEVRNPDWSTEEYKSFEKFINYIIERTFKAFNEDKELYLNKFLWGNHRFNFFSSIFSHVSRGLGCSIQQTFAVRLGDLALVPCHRTAYKGYNAGYLKFDENNNLDIEIENPNVYMFIQSFDASNSVLCVDCPISTLCNQYCLGANYEVNKDFFIPIKNVCLMEYVKVKTIINAFNRIGILNTILERYRYNSSNVSKLKRAQILRIIDNEENSNDI